MSDWHDRCPYCSGSKRIRNGEKKSMETIKDPLEAINAEKEIVEQIETVIKRVDQLFDVADFRSRTAQLHIQVMLGSRVTYLMIKLGIKEEDKADALFLFNQMLVDKFIRPEYSDIEYVDMDNCQDVRLMTISTMARTLSEWFFDSMSKEKDSKQAGFGADGLV